MTYILLSLLKVITMRQFNVRGSCLVFSDGRLRLFLHLEHTTIFIHLQPTMQNLRYGQRIRLAMLEEKIVLPMRGINEYFGRVALFR